MHRRIELIPGYLKNELIVEIHFDYNMQLLEIIKSIPGRRWNKDSKYWYIHQRHFNLEVFINKLDRHAFVDYSALKAFYKGIYTHTPDDNPAAERDEHIKRFEESANRTKAKLPSEYLEKLIRRRYSQNTIKTYVTYMRSFMVAFKDRELDSITTKEINDYIYD